MPRTSVSVRGMYVSSGKSAIGPTVSQCCSFFSKTGPRAKPTAGSVNAAAAMPPAACAVPVMKRRRETVSPSNAPGICASAVVLRFLGSLCSGDTGTEIY